MKQKICNITLHVLENYKEMSKEAAYILGGQIRLKSESVIGLATGSTPIKASIFV